MRPLPLLLLSLALGCASVPRPILTARAPLDARALEAAVDAFYLAQTPAQLRAAVADALAAGPDSAQAHEVAARLAWLEGDETGAFTHLSLALQDSTDDAAALHLVWLASTEVDLAQRAQLMALLDAVVASHPSADARAAAAWSLGLLANHSGEAALQEKAVAALDGRVPLAVVGTWDNDQGKAFEADLDPETRPGLEQTYAGRMGKMAWRREVPTDPLGRIDFAQLMTPTRFSAAFAQGTFTAPAAGRYLLRLRTSDPFKVWLDGALVAAAVQVDRGDVENLVLPVTLTAGAHTLLVKSAHRDDGGWSLSVRVTPKGDLEEPKAPAAQPAGVLDALVWYTRGMKEGPRKLAHLATWSHHLVGGLGAVFGAQAWAKQVPKSLLARTQLVEALWFNQERGRVADLLSALDRDAGSELAFISLRQARFWLQQGLKVKARERLEALKAARPPVLWPPPPSSSAAAASRREVYELEAELFASEGWSEDELRARTALVKRFPPTQDNLSNLARTQRANGLLEDAVATLRRLEVSLPRSPEVLSRLAEAAADRGALDEALEYRARRVEAWPTDTQPWYGIAALHRRRGDAPKAQEAYRRVMALCPDCSAPYSLAGATAYTVGESATAIGLWKQALERDPDNEKLAVRLDLLAPEAKGPWAQDVPDEDALEKAVASRKQGRFSANADVAYLLDHEVTQLNNDGSTVNVVTLVMHALNPAGRDRLTRQSLAAPGRKRVLHAWAIDPKGERTEASGERSGSVYFRNLQVGSTVVLQYRADAPAVGFLSRYLSKSWSFQGFGDQRVLSRFVLWAPAATALTEEKVGPLERVETPKGDFKRIQWSFAEVPPVAVEPLQPTPGEILANLKLSTVPSWDSILQWEQALLEGAFRDSPELDALAKRVGDEGSEAKGRFDRIHQYVMDEIRYQQDYENFIAGVKPHPAPMVLERKYGDCKDKAVLFIALARKLGLQAHFALVRTRDMGPVSREVPMQQFNHAIVYVPKQPGLPEDRFFDPTAELLDLDVVRSDDVGTRSLVFDPGNSQHTWRDIPYQAPAFNSERLALKLRLSKEGGAQGSLVLEAKGRTGSLLRRTARNPEYVAQFLQRTAGSLLTGASTTQSEVIEGKDLTEPAVLRTVVEAKAAARAEGDTLRLKVPSAWSPQQQFALATRKQALVFGAPRQELSVTELELPEGYAVKKLPATADFTLPCFSFTRSATQEGATVKVTQKVAFTCERVAAGDYPRYRELADGITRVQDDDLVLQAQAVKGAPKKAPAAPAR